LIDIIFLFLCAIRKENKVWRMNRKWKD